MSHNCSPHRVTEQPQICLDFQPYLHLLWDRDNVWSWHTTARMCCSSWWYHSGLKKQQSYLAATLRILQARVIKHTVKTRFHTHNTIDETKSKLTTTIPANSTVRVFCFVNYNNNLRNLQNHHEEPITKFPRYTNPSKDRFTLLMYPSHCTRGSFQNVSVHLLYYATTCLGP